MRIRKAVLTDAKGISKVHVDSWKTTYANIIPDEYLNNLAYEGREQVWKGNIQNSDVFVAENEEGKIRELSLICLQCQQWRAVQMQFMGYQRLPY
jgi:hypothetical protein